eukprot:766328-Hanusia_phi.AAC.9
MAGRRWVVVAASSVMLLVVVSQLLPPSLLPSSLLAPITIDGFAVANTPGGAAEAAAAQVGVDGRATGPAECKDCGEMKAYREGEENVKISSGMGSNLEPTAVPVSSPFGGNKNTREGVQIAQKVAGSFIDSFIQPQASMPIVWRQSETPKERSWEGSTQFTLPNVVGPGHSVNPVQVNAKIVFPKPQSKEEMIENPCAKGSGLPCPSSVYTEEDLQVCLDPSASP